MRPRKEKKGVAMEMADLWSFFFYVFILILFILLFVITRGCSVGPVSLGEGGAYNFQIEGEIKQTIEDRTLLLNLLRMEVEWADGTLETVGDRIVNRDYNTVLCVDEETCPGSPELKELRALIKDNINTYYEVPDDPLASAVWGLTIHKRGDEVFRLSNVDDTTWLNQGCVSQSPWTAHVGLPLHNDPGYTHVPGTRFHVDHVANVTLKYCGYINPNGEVAR